MLFKKPFKYREPHKYIPWQEPYFSEALSRRNYYLSKEPHFTEGAYAVLDMIEGGMSNIYISRSQNSNQLYVLKKTKDTQRNIFKMKRVFAEEIAKAIDLQLDFTLIAQDVLWDSIKYESTLVLPYCAGGSLGKRIFNNHVNMNEIIFYFLCTSIGLKHLHDNSVLHLDIKPHNILLAYFDNETNPFWSVVISDFGISQQLEKGHSIHCTAGTLPYMSPEQIMGQPVSEKSDIWSFGATFYHLITNRLPFGDEGCFDLRKQQFRSKPASPASLNKMCPQWLSDLIMDCLAVDPNKRPSHFDYIMDSVLGEVRVEDEAGIRSSSKDNPSLVIIDGFLLLCLARIKRSPSVHATITIGWVGIYERARKLFATHETGPTRKALKKLNQLLGSTSESDSPISQFVADPSKDRYDFETYWERINRIKADKLSLDINLPMSPGTVRAFLDLKMCCLITLIEDLALSRDITEAANLVELCEKSKSFGIDNAHIKDTPIKVNLSSASFEMDPHYFLGPAAELYRFRMAQIYRLIGDLGIANICISASLKTWPDNLGFSCLLALIYFDMEDYEGAMKIIKEGIDLSARQKDFRFLIHFHLLYSSCLLELDDPGRAARVLIDSFEKSNRQPAFIPYMLQAFSRNNKRSTREDLDRVLEIAKRENNFSIWTIASEVAYRANERELAVDIADYLLHDPRSALPTRKREKQLCNDILNGTL
jgi:serine/threonine protein kinase